MTDSIYLDYAATTPLRPEARDAMLPYLNAQFGNLARTDNITTIAWDSGGGWSWTTTAWGVDKGVDGLGRGYFTPVQAAQTALNVTIKTK